MIQVIQVLLPQTRKPVRAVDQFHSGQAPSGRGSDFSVELLRWGSATGGNSSILQHDLRDLLGKQLTVLIESV